MVRMQVLFPDPQLSRLRRLAKQQDRPVSELIRSAVDLRLSRYGSENEFTEEKAPVYSCGGIKIAAEDLGEAAYKKP